MLPSELEKNLEDQLSTHLTSQLQEKSGILDQAELENLSSSSDVAHQMQVARRALSRASEMLSENGNVVDKYYNLCNLVRGLVGDFRQAKSELKASQERVKRLAATVGSQRKQIDELNSLVESLQSELLERSTLPPLKPEAPAANDVLESDLVSKSQVADMVRDMLGTDVSPLDQIRSEIPSFEEYSSYCEEPRIEFTPTTRTSEPVKGESRPGFEESTAAAERYAELMGRIDRVLTQIKDVDKIGSGQIAA